MAQLQLQMLFVCTELASVWLLIDSNRSQTWNVAEEVAEAEVTGVEAVEVLEAKAVVAVGAAKTFNKAISTPASAK